MAPHCMAGATEIRELWSWQSPAEFPFLSSEPGCWALSITPEAAVRAKDQIRGFSDASKWDKDTAPAVEPVEEAALETTGSRKSEGRGGRVGALLMVQGNEWKLLVKLRCRSELQSLLWRVPETAMTLWRSGSSGVVFSQSLSSLSQSSSSSMSSRSLRCKSFSSLQSLESKQSKKCEKFNLSLRSSILFSFFLL